MTKDNVLLGLSKVDVGGNNIGFSRGGSNFTVNRVFHDIKADGDMGTDKDSVILDEERATLTINMLETDFNKIAEVFPAMVVSQGVLTPTGTVVTTNFKDVICVAKRKNGKFVKITLKDAICKSNIVMQMNEKDEVVINAVFEATYAPRTDLWAYEAPYKLEEVDSI